MNKRHPRVIGTTDEAISTAEAQLAFKFPPSFRDWLLQNNGKGIEDITIFPVYDDRDARKTSDSIVRNFNESWKRWIETFDGSTNFRHLLPFGECGSGDFYCFDYSRPSDGAETPVVVWFHETGATEVVSEDFRHFIEVAEKGELDS